MRLLASPRALVRRPHGGAIPRQPDRGRPIILSPGRRITDPDEAEALGLTAHARRMRETTT